MAPKSPVKKVIDKNVKDDRGKLRSKSRIPQRTKSSLTQGVEQDASNKKAAVASTSKLKTTEPATAPSVAPYQSTPRRAPVPVKPSRVASVSPGLLKKVTSRALIHKLKGSPRVQRRPSHQKENLSPDSKHRLSERSSSPETSSDRHRTKTLAKVTMVSSPRVQRHSSLLAHKSSNVSSGGRRRRSIQKNTQRSTFIRPADEAKPPYGGARRASSSAATAVDPAADESSAELSDGGSPAKRSSAGVSDDEVIHLKESPDSPGSKAVKLLSAGGADRSKHASPTSRRNSLSRSTTRQGSTLHARRHSGPSFHTPVASVINGTPSRQGGSALNTPFRSQAPKSARRQSLIPLSDPKVKHTPEQLDLWEQQIKEWLYRSWKLCFMSALKDFEIQTKSMRTAYQNTLRQLISETVPFTLQVTIEARNCFSRDANKVDVIALSISYSVPEEWDVQQQRQTAAAAMASGDAALAAASNRHKKKKGKNKSEGAVKAKASNMTAGTSRKKTLYTALLVRADMRDGEAEQAGVSWYPIFLYAGRESVHHLVVQWLQDSFGSLVCQRSLQAPTLLWAAGLWMQQSCGLAKEDDDQKEQALLEYQLTGLGADGWQQNDRLPSSRRSKDVSKVTMEVPAFEMRRIAKCIVPDDSAEGGSVSEGERDLLHSVLQNMVHFLTKLPQTALRLRAVNTACVSISSTGEIKVMCRRHLKGVLNFLLELHKEDSLLDQVNADSFEDLEDLDSSRGSLNSEK